MGISRVTVKKVGGFNYTARDGKNCENEYCAILIGSYDGKIKPKSKEVYSTKSVPFKDFIDLGGWVKARELGKVQSVGKDYVMKDDEVVEFKVGV